MPKAKSTVLPEGFTYREDFISEDEERCLVESLSGLEFHTFEMHGVQTEDLAEVLVTEYQPGAGIGWHRDAPMFDRVVGVSLASPCRFRFRRGKGETLETTEFTPAPRSAYILDGEARRSWQHSIPGIKDLRYSVTF